MSEQKSTTTKYAWTVNDLSTANDLPAKPPPITRMSTGAIIDGVFMTKDEMMFKMSMDADKKKKEV